MLLCIVNAEYKDKKVKQQLRSTFHDSPRSAPAPACISRLKRGSEPIEAQVFLQIPNYREVAVSVIWLRYQEVSFHIELLEVFNQGAL